MKSLIFSVMLLSVIFQKDDLTKSVARGKEVYTDFCVTCHKPDGTGTPKFFPPLAKADYLTKQREDAIRSVKYGQKGKITVNGIDYNGMMPNPGLTDDEVADVMNYILNSWGNSGSKMVTLDEVKKVEKK
jgi:mono/diheme cytochrome c family protein